MTARSHKLLLVEGPALALLVVIAHALAPAAPVASAANEWHVCKSNVNDFPTIQAAVNFASPNDVIKVAAGVYTESHDTYNVYISKTVHLFGGYTCAFTTRDTANNVTIIRPSTPNISVVYIDGAKGALTPTLDGFTISGGGGGNHGGGLRATDSNALIRNNTITDNIGFLYGGGIWVQRGAPRIENNRVENNVVTGSGNGGGVDLEDSQASLIGNVVAGNVISDAIGGGGGIAVLGGGPVVLSGNAVLSNTAADGYTGYGGGIYLSSVTATVSSNLVQGNIANAYNSGYGGGIYIGGNAPATLSGNAILSNTATYQGFAIVSNIAAYGGGIYLDGTVASLNGDRIQGNVGNQSAYGFFNSETFAYAVGLGGGVFVSGSTITLTNVSIQDNAADAFPVVYSYGYGGGMYASNSLIRLGGGSLQGNMGSRSSSGVYGSYGALFAGASALTLDAIRVQNNRADPADTNVGGIDVENGRYTMTNLLVTGNSGTYAGGLRVYQSTGLLVNNTFASNGSIGILSDSPLTLTNNIIMGHTTGVSLTAVVSVNSSYNDYWANADPALGYSLGPSDIIVNPLLASNYHLTAGSPLIDAGTPTNAPDHDIDGEPRPSVGTSGQPRFDIGADEWRFSKQYLPLIAR